jgi:hypothetical protein
LSKLEHYGIQGTFGALIKPYLKERYQRVAIRDKTNTIRYSHRELVRHGVPQGSILGPLLFLLYINDLPIVTANKAKLVLYSDDTSFIISNPSPTEIFLKVNKIFTDVNEWFTNRLLSLNLGKTTYLQFQTKNSQIPDSNIILLNNEITVFSRQ